MRLAFLLISLAIVGCAGGDDNGESAKTRRSLPEVPSRPAGKWAEVTVPGSICGAKRPIVLRRGYAVVKSNRWPRYRRVGVLAGWDGARYGDLDGDGNRDEAAWGVGCNNRGGTAAGFLTYARVLFADARSRRRRVVGVVTPRQRPLPHKLPTLLIARIEPGKVIVHEKWYGPRDGTCCPTGRSTTTWQFADAELTPRQTVVQRRPDGLREVR